MSAGPRVKQFGWFVFGAGILALSGLLHAPLKKQSLEGNLIPDNIVAEKFPEITLLAMAPGGLRAPLINYLWIRSQRLHQDGRHFDAMQLAELICLMQPRFAGVWEFQAWNMAWNISVTTHTPEERWRWVHNGLKLIRDKAIPLNPTSIKLYDELARIFFSKMGGDLDDMHIAYKQQWAKKMQTLLASPPFGTTAEAIEAFKPIAEVRLDRDKHRQGTDLIQADQLELLLGGDPDAAKYAKLLSARGVNIDQSLLDAYNKFSRDDAVQVIRNPLSGINLKSAADKAIAAAINNLKYAQARTKLLAFVRAQILWNEYKMDPQWMLHLMTSLNVPIDWRMPVAHGLYWITKGIDITEHRETGEVKSLNVDRMVLNCLKNMTWNGRMTYVDNPAKPNYPHISWGADWRYIAPTHKKHDEIITKLIGVQEREYKDNQLRSGHINYLVAAIEMLFRLRRTEQAGKHLEWINKTYQPNGDQWKLPLDEFVYYQITKDGDPIPSLARNQLTATLQMAMYFLAAGDNAKYRSSINYVRRIYKAYQSSVPDRIKLPPLAVYAANELAKVLVHPRSVGFNLGLEARIKLYSLIGRRWPGADRPSPQLIVYDFVTPYLKRECQANQLDFNRSFPPPPGLKTYRAKRAIQLKQKEKPKPQ